MIGLSCFALAVLASPFKSKLRLQAENAVLRHQLNVLRRRLHGRVRRLLGISVSGLDRIGTGGYDQLSLVLGNWRIAVRICSVVVFGRIRAGGRRKREPHSTAQSRRFEEHLGPAPNCSSARSSQLHRRVRWQSAYNRFQYASRKTLPKPSQRWIGKGRMPDLWWSTV